MLARHILHLAVVKIALISALALHTEGQAQPSLGAAGSEENAPICMSRTHDAVPQVRAERRGKPFYILAVERSVPGLKARGFSIVDCAKAKLARQGQVKRYRDQVCDLASKGNEAVQNQLERALGERPATLCANAQVIAGRWQRGRSFTK